MRRQAYSRSGIRCAMPVMPAMMLLWEIMTPLGMPVEPLVYMMTAMSDGSGWARGFVSTGGNTHTRTHAGVPTHNMHTHRHKHTQKLLHNKYTNLSTGSA